VADLVAAYREKLSALSDQELLCDSFREGLIASSVVQIEMGRCAPDLVGACPRELATLINAVARHRKALNLVYLSLSPPNAA
jgi:hypothetical protein